MSIFSKERLENTMKLQGIKSYKELGELMGYGENIDIKRFICDEIPLNVLSNLCNTLKVSRDYLMMESDNDNLKEIHIVPDQPIVRTGGGRPYRYISDPINYECNDIDIDRLNKLIEESKIKMPEKWNQVGKSIKNDFCNYTYTEEHVLIEYQQSLESIKCIHNYWKNIAPKYNLEYKTNYSYL